MADIESTLQERGERYGSFEHHAKIAQDLQRVMHAEDGWAKLADDQRQALTVIMDKVARMLVIGDPAYRDNWHDIVGYAKLVDDRTSRDESAARATAADASYAPALRDGDVFLDIAADAIGQNGNGGGHYETSPAEWPADEELLPMPQVAPPKVQGAKPWVFHGGNGACPIDDHRLVEATLMSGKRLTAPSQNIMWAGVRGWRYVVDVKV